MTICFKSEWTNEKGHLRAIPHITTTNLSFLRTCALLKKMGISNYAFPLALYDPDLKDVDVYSLDEDTPENINLRIKVQIEARRNVFYFLRECVKIYSQGGDPVRFRLDRSSCAMTWCFVNGIDYAGMAPRQLGKTVCALSLVSWVMYSSGSDFNVGHLAKDSNLREENVKRIRSVAETLPKWWLVEDKFRDKKNTEELYYNALKTHFSTLVAQADPRKADLNARGASFPVLWIDEAEFCINIGVSYPTMLASTGTARENARLNGKPYSNLITTTAGDPSNPACRQSASILDGAMAFTEKLYDIESNEKLHEIVKAASPQKMILGVFSHLQLGKTNEWLRDLVTRNKMTREQVLRDFLNRRVSIAEQPIIPKDILASITRSQTEPQYIEIISDRFVVYWYVNEETVKSQAFKDRSIVLGCDSSEMIDRDATTLIGTDPTDLSVVCTFRCSEGNLSKLGMMIATFLLRYPKMLWVPENKSSGTSLIDIVTMILHKEQHNPFRRIFNWVVNNQNEPEFSRYDYRDMALLETQAKRYFGIKTDKSKRDELYGSTLLEGASKGAHVVRDQTLIQELGSLTARNGRIDHAAGGHDDMVVAWLMALWVIFNGKHLHVYGIKPGTVMSHINPGQPDKNRLSFEHDEKIRLRIEHLENMCKQQADPMLKKHIQADINVYKSMIKNSPIQSPETVDELIRDPRRFSSQAISEDDRRNNPERSEKTFRLAMGLVE